MPTAEIKQKKSGRGRAWVSRLARDDSATWVRGGPARVQSLTDLFFTMTEPYL
jgi:hypothetical protein